MQFIQEHYESEKIILEKFPALPFADRDQLPKCSGVYFVFNGQHIVYIGKTRNLFGRWVSHHRKNDIVHKYNLNKILISYSPLPADEIDYAEAWIINKYMPPINVSIPSVSNKKNISSDSNQDLIDSVENEISNWLCSNETKISSIPDSVKDLVYFNSKCNCSICGKITERKKARFTKFELVENNTIENLALICTQCTSRMRSSNNIADFKVQQQKIARRELKKIQNFIELYYENSSGIFDRIINLIDTQEIRLYIDRK